MMKTFSVLGTFALATLIALPAAARHHDHHTRYARVIDARPIYQSASYQVPEQVCHYETVSYRDNDGPRSYTGTIVGGLVGAAVGHELGNSKRNKDVGAVAGGLLGATIGRDVSNRNNRTTTRYRDEQVCQTRYRSEYSQHITGYNVTYRYKGRVYQTQTRHHPGDRIPVDVQVRPAYGYR